MPPAPAVGWGVDWWEPEEDAELAVGHPFRTYFWILAVLLALYLLFG